MRITSKIKSIFIFLIFILCICGVLFIRDALFPVKKQVENIIKPLAGEKQDLSGTMRELEKCQSELFFTKNDNEKLRVMPDARKDTISLLLNIRNIEEKIGRQKDLSNECVKLFATAYRVPDIQEIVVKYKETLFNTKCQIATEDEIVALIVPFEISVLDKKYEDKSKTEENGFMKFVNKVLHKTSKATKEMNITHNSPLENLVIKKQYENALKMIEGQYNENYKIKDSDIDVAVKPEYKILHDALESLYIMNKMISELYTAIEKSENYV